MVDGPVWLPDEPPSLEQFLSPTLQPVPILPVIGLALGLLYLWGAISLWTRGRRWPILRVVSFLAGCALLVVVTGAGVEGYGYLMFSVFMFQQLTLMIAVPPLLVLGAPGTLLLRAVPHRRAGRWVLAGALGALRSRGARWLLHPALSIPLFLVAYYGLYLTGLADALLRTWGGHLTLELLFFASGMVFAVPLLSPDPLPVRSSYPKRALEAFAEAVLHAFFGVVVMMSTRLLVPYFGEPSASVGVDPLEDQGIAGGLAWGYGEGPTLLILLFLAHAWFRTDTAEGRQRDAKADRDGDQELEQYNQYLGRLGRGPGSPGGS